MMDKQVDLGSACFDGHCQRSRSGIMVLGRSDTFRQLFVLR